MNHRKAFRKLSRTSTHRKALFRNMLTSLILNNRIETTLPKAKELKRIADKMITLGKKNTLHARRQALGYLMPVDAHATSASRDQLAMKRKDSAVHKLFTELAPSYADRNGGYTRVMRGRLQPVGKRLDAKRAGDNAQMAIIEFVTGKVEKKAKKTRRTTKKMADTAPAAEAASEGSQADSPA